MDEGKFRKLSATAGVRNVFWCCLVDNRIAGRIGDGDAAVLALCCAVPDGETWIVHRRPAEQRVTVRRKGDRVLAVTTEIGHPISKSLNRMMERAMR